MVADRLRAFPTKKKDTASTSVAISAQAEHKDAV